MIAQVAFLMKALSAHVADELLEFAVGSNVRLQGGRSVERLLADVALVGLFRSVNNLVPAKSARQAEPFAAYAADERPGPGVGGHLQVDGQSVLGFEDLAALLALVGLPASGT